MPDLPDAYPVQLPLDAQRLIDDACDAFEARLRAGAEPRIEEALAGAPEAYRPYLFRELKKMELEYRQKNADDDYRRRFPEYESAIETPRIPMLVASSEVTATYLNGAPTLDESFPTIPGYEILAKLGEGGMGVVYKARQIKLGRVVALKMLRSGHFAGPQERQRFRFEAEAIAALDHGNIVSVYEVGEVDGVSFLCLKHLEGGSLADRLAGGVPCDPKQAAALVVQIARAIHHAHARGVLHRDLKPANILLDHAGQPHVADFGLARRLDREAGLTMTGEMLGTVQYMAPEQARGERVLTIATDIYGVGTTLYALLTGRPPFRGANTMETLQLVQEHPVRRPSEINAGVSTDLETICLKCLEKDAASRYSSASALADDLERYLNDQPIEGQKSTVVTLVRRLLLGRKETPTLVTLSVFWWLAGLVFLFNSILWLLGALDAPVWSVWLLQGTLFVSSLAVNWRYHVQNDSLLTAMERYSMAIHVAHQLAVIALLVMLGPTDPHKPARELFDTWIPVVTLVTGIGWYAHGTFGWGECYILGLAFFPLALLLRFWPPFAPLLYGAALGISLLWAGWRMRHMVSQTQARQERQA